MRLFNRRGLCGEKKKQIQAMGVAAALKSPNRYRFTSETAAIAGRIGGASVSKNREHMREIGRRGGLRRQGKI